MGSDALGKEREVDKLKPKYILIAGSASKTCDSKKLERALEFVREATVSILRSGNSVTVFASRENFNADNHPVVFDWEILRAVGDYLTNESGSAERILARVVTGADSLEKRFGEENASLMQQLQSKRAVQVHYIPEGRYTGGNHRAKLVEISDAMIAVGGGTGAYDNATLMIEAGKPVMPMDIQIGSSRDDGDGALQLLSEMKNDPKRFLRYGHEVVSEKILALSLERPYESTRRVANVIARMLTIELAGRNNKALRLADTLARPLFILVRKPSMSVRSMYYGAKILKIFSDMNFSG